MTRSTRIRFATSLLIFASLCGTQAASAQTAGTALAQQAALTAPSGATYDQFGGAVALSADGTTALVGANQYFSNGPGAAYVFTRSGGTWSLQQRLTAADGTEGDQFGLSVALSADGTVALIGAPTKGHSWQGAVYSFVRHGRSWTEQQKLAAADGAVNDEYGRSVALSADGATALIGAAGKSVGGRGAQGAAYVLVRQGGVWRPRQRLTAADGAQLDNFGDSVALSADGAIALVGAAKEYNFRSQGVAYVFVRHGNTWSQQQRLAAADGTAHDLFGSSVALSGDGTTALIGADGQPRGHNRAQGAAYVFMRRQSTWSQQQQLVAADGTAAGFFGSAVALSGDGQHALITGTHGHLGPVLSVAYLFARQGGAWSQQQEIAPSVRAFNDDYGISVALSGDGVTALAGADDRNVGRNSRQGAAYVFGPRPQSTATPTSGAGA